MMAPMRIVICGYYGFSNAGDELILDSTVALLRNQFDSLEIAVISYPRGDLAAVHQRLGITAIDGRDIAHCSTMIRSADLLLIGGGGLIQDYLPSDRRDLFLESHSNLVFWMTMAAIARIHQVPAIGWQLGIGPLETDQGRDDAATLLGLMDRIFVRDQASYDLAIEIGVDARLLSVGGDPVLTFDVAHSTPDRARLGIVVRTWLEKGDWFQALAEAIDGLDPGIEVIFYPMQETDRHLEDDVSASRTVVELMQRPAEIVTSLAPVDLAGALASCTAVVSMRLHGALLALSSGVPVVAMAYDPKVESQMVSLGQKRFVAQIGELDRDWLASALADAMEHTVEREPIAKAAEKVRHSLSQLEDRRRHDARPLPADIVERLIAGRAAEIQYERREAARAVGESRAELAAATTEIVRLQSELDATGRRAAEAVARYDELAGSRAVSVASTAWRVTRRLKSVLRR